MTSSQCAPVAAVEPERDPTGGPSARTLSVAQLQAAYWTRDHRPRLLHSIRPAATHTPDGGCARVHLDDDERYEVPAAVPAGCVAIVSASPGAGGSTVALAIADAAATRGPAHLIDTAPPARSGLVGAPCAELGLDATGEWRHGTRGFLAIDRRASGRMPEAWPAGPAGSQVLTVVDLGPIGSDDGGLCAGAEARMVVACRATVPGIAHAERVLEQLAAEGLPAGPVLVAALGPARWPAAVAIACGPRLRALRSEGRVVAVPLDRRLEITGLSSRPLPRAVRAAGRTLVGLLDGQPRTARASGGRLQESRTAPARRWASDRANVTTASGGSSGGEAISLVTGAGGWS